MRAPRLALGAAAVVITGLLAAACSGGGSTAAKPSASTPPSSTAAASAPPTTTPSASVSAAPVKSEKTVWLCRPGMHNDPCAGSLTSTVITARNHRSIQPATASGSKRFDCFYLYPTASMDKRGNSTLKVTSAETSIARDQAARFSQVCDVWAPMYKQITVNALIGGKYKGSGTVAYNSVLSAWDDFLAHHDDNRPIVFISHSQGSVMMIKLLQSQVDPSPALRARTVSVIIAGGNITNPTGETVGGTFKHLPLCTAPTQTGCVIAYSTFPSEPPAITNFGRPGQGISTNSGQTATVGVQVACVNPAAIGSSGTAALSPYFPVAPVLPLSNMTPPAPAVTTTWVTYPHEYSGTCRTDGSATWLEVAQTSPKSDLRPKLTERFGPGWGYHLDDLNIPLGNLVNDVRREEAAYSAAS
jgi:hypothetical protein